MAVFEATSSVFENLQFTDGQGIVSDGIGSTYYHKRGVAGTAYAAAAIVAEMSPVPV